jgi:hypothetical protein
MGTSGMSVNLFSRLVVTVCDQPGTSRYRLQAIYSIMTPEEEKQWASQS